MKTKKGKVILVTVSCLLSLFWTAGRFIFSEEIYFTDILEFITLFLMKALVIVFLFYSLMIDINVLKDYKKSGTSLNKLEKSGLIIQIVFLFTVSFLTSLMVFIELLGVGLISIGVFQYLRSPTKLTISFILSGIALLFLGYSPY